MTGNASALEYSTKRQRPQAAGYREIRDRFVRKDFAAAERLSADYLKSHPAGAERADVLYLQAMSLLELGRVEESKDRLRQIDPSYADIHDIEAESTPVIEPPPPPAERPAPPRPTAEEGGFFTVQVGSFASGNNAADLLNKLRDESYDAYIERPSGKRMYRVRVGRLASREEAAALEARLKKDGYPTRIFP